MRAEALPPETFPPLARRLAGTRRDDRRRHRPGAGEGQPDPARGPEARGRLPPGADADGPGRPRRRADGRARRADPRALPRPGRRRHPRDARAGAALRGGGARRRLPRAHRQAHPGGRRPRRRLERRRRRADRGQRAPAAARRRRALHAIAAEIGSDVPFFLGPARRHRARARGDPRARPARCRPCALVLAHPGRPLATRDVYEAFEPHGPVPERLPPVSTLHALAALVANDLGPVAEELEPALREPARGPAGPRSARGLRDRVRARRCSACSRTSTRRTVRWTGSGMPRGRPALPFERREAHRSRSSATSASSARAGLRHRAGAKRASACG